MSRLHAATSDQNKDRLKMSLGERIRLTREKAGKSAREVSIAAGLSPGTVQAIESNPNKSPRLENVQSIAEVLGVSLSFLAEGKVSNSRVDGFNESDAEPFIPRPPAGQRPDLVDPHRQLPQILAPSGRQLATFRLRSSMPGFALMPGDVLVVDFKTPAKAGDLVLANVADLALGSASTVLRRFLPPYLVANDATSDSVPLVVDNHRTSIVGRVAASFRAPQLSSS
jgi:transcriptional regulator with XRE-family HTH domain